MRILIALAPRVDGSFELHVRLPHSDNYKSVKPTPEYYGTLLEITPLLLPRSFADLRTGQSDLCWPGWLHDAQAFPTRPTSNNGRSKAPQNHHWL